jgi:hypothetical protein
MAETTKEKVMGKDHSTLAEALVACDNAFKLGRDVDPILLRELCARCEADEHLRVQLRDCADHWPRWAREPVLEGVMLSIARKNGEARPLVALKMDLQQHAPQPDVLPLQAWTVLNMWLRGRHKIIALLGNGRPLISLNYILKSSAVTL